VLFLTLIVVYVQILFEDENIIELGVLSTAKLTAHLEILLVKPMENMKHSNLIATALWAFFGVMSFTVEAASVPCSKGDLAGSWLAVVNTTGSNSIQKCTIAFNTIGKITSGSCLDMQSKYTFLVSGSSSINSQCGVSLNLSLKNLVVITANGAMSRGKDDIISTFTNTLGKFGSISAVKY
jgi:hypothetical protein